MTSIPVLWSARRAFLSKLRVSLKPYAGLGLVAGLGFLVIGTQNYARPVEEARLLNENMRLMHESVLAMRQGVETLNMSVAQNRTESIDRQAVLEERLAAFEKKIVQVEKASGEIKADPALLERIAKLEERLAALEAPKEEIKPMASMLPPPRPSQVALNARPSSLWRVRSVDDGYALIESAHGFMEVAEGHFIPGVGRVESVVQRGREWVVVTNRGTIRSTGPALARRAPANTWATQGR